MKDQKRNFRLLKSVRAVVWEIEVMKAWLDVIRIQIYKKIGHPPFTISPFHHFTKLPSHLHLDSRRFKSLNDPLHHIPVWFIKKIKFLRAFKLCEFVLCNGMIG